MKMQLVILYKSGVEKTYTTDVEEAARNAGEDVPSREVLEEGAEQIRDLVAKIYKGDMNKGNLTWGTTVIDIDATASVDIQIID